MICESSCIESPSLNFCDRIDELITDILALTRKGNAVGETERVELSTVVERGWGTVDTPEATLDVTGTTTVDADPGRLQQVFENLFRNAIEHGGGSITIQVGVLGDEGGFYVEDDGSGIPESDHESVFEEKFTTNETNTGFGLAIVEQIVEAHGWTVRIGDDSADGARFEIRTDGGRHVES